jgi:hypothetical protein
LTKLCRRKAITGNKKSLTQAPAGAAAAEKRQAKLIHNCNFLVDNFFKKSLALGPFVWYIITMKATKTSWNKFDKGTQVHHRDNHQWKGVVVRDLDRGMPVNGVVLVNHNGRVARMHKDLLRVSFHLDAKKEFEG